MVAVMVTSVVVRTDAVGVIAEVVPMPVRDSFPKEAWTAAGAACAECVLSSRASDAAPMTPFVLKRRRNW